LKNIAVIGYGRWGRNLVRNFAQLKALYAVCDSDAVALCEIEKLYPDVVRLTDYNALLESDKVQGVVVATPSDMHYRIAKEALVAGKDVFVEKPLALSVEEGRELVKLAEENRLILLVGHLLEYHPAIVKLKEIVDDGILGRINYISSTRLDFGSVQKNSDVLWTYAPHDLDTILLLVNRMPISVSVHSGDYIQEGVADVAFTTIEFKAGLKALLFLSWLYPHKERRLVVIGDKGMVVFDDVGLEKLKLYKQAVEWKNGMPVLVPTKGKVIVTNGDEPLRLECWDFIECMASRQPPRVSVDRALKALELLVACQESMSNRGKVVKFPVVKVDYFAHQTATIDEGSKIGQRTKIWHYSHVCKGAIIGCDCVIGQNCYIGPNVKIGNGVKIQNNVSVYEGVTLEDRVFCGPSCVFTNDKYPSASADNRNNWLPTLVRKNAVIGANATIVCGVRIGRSAMVAAGAVVTKSVPDRAIVMGNPAKVEYVDK